MLCIPWVGVLVMPCLVWGNFKEHVSHRDKSMCTERGGRPGRERRLGGNGREEGRDRKEEGVGEGEGEDKGDEEGVGEGEGQAQGSM